MIDLVRIQALLRRRGNGDLAELLNSATTSVVTWDECFGDERATVDFLVPVDAYEQLRVIASPAYQTLLNAVRDIHPLQTYGADIQALRFLLDPESLDDAQDHESIIRLIETQKGLMIDVATGGQRINAVNAEYQHRQEKIGALMRSIRLIDPNTYQDLWEWYGKWSADLPSYQSRREYINELYQPLLDQLRSSSQVDQPEPTGWPLVDRQLSEMRARLAAAETEEQYQAVGLLCRETLISLAQTVYDPVQHPSTDGIAPSETDGKRMLTAYLAVELTGSSNGVA
ncbi:MAG TPA: hypothetical protein VEQ60_23790, partial [Longimicrobium sp.]|nr:hypothetical protein [Longimicrobium sp.]